ncbi:MAG: MFS transporter [Anaerolineales bacterium]|nr:MFS transporter [Anaerolineales bacterium]
MKSTFRALRHKKFSSLLFGQTLSRIGDFLFQIAIAWWVLEKTGSASAMGTVLIVNVLPMLLFVLIGGVVVDRMPRGLLLFGSDAARCLIMVVGAWLSYTNQLQLWQIYVMSLLFGFADAFFLPAYNALIQQIISEEDLPSANSINSLSMQFGRVAGPAIGGLIVGFGGTTAALGFNALSFLIGALTVIPLLNTPAPARAEQIESFLKHFIDDIRDGFATIFSTPILWVAIIVFAFTNITLGGPYNIAMPFLVQQELGGDEKMLGFIYAIFPIGYAIASLIMGSFQRLRYRGILFYVCGAIAGIGLGVFGLGLPLYILVFAALLNGAALEIDSLIWTNIMQEKVPPEKMGRVSSVDTLGSYVLLPIGFAVTGWLIDTVGVKAVFIAAGGMTAIISLLPLLHPVIRKLD